MPQIGEVKYNKNRDRLVWLACLNCNKERWVKVDDIRKPNYTGLCHTCCLRRRNGKREFSPHWKGGISHSAGYVKVLLQLGHPFYSMSNALGYVKRGRLVMAAHLGRPLDSKEIVHHKNQVKDDDLYENLRLFPGHAEHTSDHRVKDWFTRQRNHLGQFI